MVCGKIGDKVQEIVENCKKVSRKSLNGRKRRIVLKKIQKMEKLTLAIYERLMYTNHCCGMIAMKREVAAEA